MPARAAALTAELVSDPPCGSGTVSRHSCSASPAGRPSAEPPSPKSAPPLSDSAPTVRPRSHGVARAASLTGRQSRTEPHDVPKHTSVPSPVEPTAVAEPGASSPGRAASLAGPLPAPSAALPSVRDHRRAPSAKPQPSTTSGECFPGVSGASDVDGPVDPALPTPPSSAPESHGSIGP